MTGCLGDGFSAWTVSSADGGAQALAEVIRKCVVQLARARAARIAGRPRRSPVTVEQAEKTLRRYREMAAVRRQFADALALSAGVGVPRGLSFDLLAALQRGSRERFIVSANIWAAALANVGDDAAWAAVGDRFGLSPELLESTRDANRQMQALRLVKA